MVYACYDDQNTLKGIAIEARGQGYADILKVLYGYDAVSQTIVGFYVLESKETPGLGDKIEKDEKFLTNFNVLTVAINDDFTQVVNKVVDALFGSQSQTLGGMQKSGSRRRCIGGMRG